MSCDKYAFGQPAYANYKDAIAEIWYADRYMEKIFVDIVQ